MKIKQFIVISSLLLATLVACKKTKVTPAPTTPAPTTPTTTASRADLTRDSLYLYAQQIYYWNDALPTYETFNPRKYTTGSSDLANYNNELFAITQYKVNPTTGRPFEYYDGNSAKYSYIQDIASKNPTAYINTTASVDLEGNGNDLGVRFGFYGSDANFTTYVTAVYDKSPADNAGLKRGDVITKINGTTYGTNFSANRTAIVTAINGANITLEGVKSTGASFNITLTKAVFKSSPIYKNRIITAGTKKVGYLAYARFSNSTNSIDTLNAIFRDFANGGVTDLVIDLRYNGGGYVSTAEHLINLIIPSSASGVMFTEYYNTTMQTGQAKILANQPLLDANDKPRYGANGVMLNYFANVDYSVAGNTTRISKKGSLNNISSVVFIVSGSTASASELVINSLKPYVTTLKIVGQTTYGKPIGFFPIRLENKYDVYFSLFETKNAAGQGGYFAGMTPDVTDVEVPAGTVMYDFGNVNDNYLKKALNVIAPGVTVTSQAKTSAVVERQFALPASNVINVDLGKDEFKGMIETRFKTKN